ncbi:XRE family transcriptional regulator [Corynebacterium diphtheriae]|nr:XRE family transcriptional regulator [Corynebacterium diphtheriae]CAB1008738.1 XRE family transcriptional regulator [Corynebacterium diphtheriae]
MTAKKDRLKQHAKELLRSQRALREGLVELRRGQNLSQKDVAERLGISQSAVAQFEGYDANPTLNAIRRYALAVGADIEFIVRPRRVVSEPVKSHETVIQRNFPGAEVNWGASYCLDTKSTGGCLI